MRQTKIEPGREFQLSKNTDRAMAELIGVINNLRDVYEEENQALKACDTKRFLALNDSKLQAVSDWQSCHRQIAARREEFRRVHPDIRTHLMAMEADFSQLATENLELLSRLSKSVNRLGGRIKKAVVDAAQKKTVNYGSSGSLNHNDRPVSISINQSA